MSWQMYASDTNENQSIKISFDKKEAEQIVCKELFRFSLTLPTNTNQRPFIYLSKDMMKLMI